MPRPKIVLPEKYYLAHFREFTVFLKLHYLDFCDLEHRKFLQDFEGLSEDAQCYYLRVANRRGLHFHKSSLRYGEIRDPEAAAAELVTAGFLTTPSAAQLGEILERLEKTQFQNLLRALEIAFRDSWTRARLAQALLMSPQSAELPESFFAAFVSQGRVEELAFLKYLFFGELHDDLGLYTLRDLKIRQTNTLKETFVARFKTREEARAQYFYATRLDRIEEFDTDEFAKSATEIANWPIPLNSYTRSLREDLLLEIARGLESGNRFDEALAVYTQCSSHPGSERRARLLYKLGRKDETQSYLEQLLEHSQSEAEITFAQDYLLRKFQKKRTHVLTDMLQQAPTLMLDESYLQSAERGVQDQLRRQGKIAFRTENYLWNALFGLIFWDELFEGQNSGIHSPFDRSPQNLLGGDFYRENAAAIEAHLTALTDTESSLNEILATITRHAGQLNGIFQWHDSLTRVVPEFLRAAPPGAIAMVLRTMAQDFANRHSGFPDLLQIDEQGIKFIEVKAEGDSLRPGQFQQILLLRAAGFAVELLKVEWHVDPNQIYVVVDIETTGGRPGTHRVTEVAAVKVRGQEVIDTFSSLINPERHIPHFITELTGISDEMVADAPRFAEIADAFDAFTSDGVFVAHNVRFDYGFIQSEFARLDREFVRRKICTVVSMRRTHPGLKSYSLKNLCAEFAIDLNGHHRALNDALATSKLLMRINAKKMKAPPTLSPI